MLVIILREPKRRNLLNQISHFNTIDDEQAVLSFESGFQHQKHHLLIACHWIIAMKFEAIQAKETMSPHLLRDT